MRVKVLCYQYYSSLKVPNIIFSFGFRISSIIYIGFLYGLYEQICRLFPDISRKSAKLHFLKFWFEKDEFPS